MSALLRKELRGLLPVWVLVLFVLGVLDLAFTPLSARPDEQTWTALNPDILPGAGAGHALVLLVLGLVVAYSAFPREHDEQTIELLYCLPIPRGGIFLAKLLAGAIVLGSGVAFEQGVHALLVLPNTQSFTGEQWRAAVALRLALLHGAFAGIVLCHGLLLSFARKFGLIAVAMAGFAALLVRERAPQLVWLDPTRLLALRYEGATLVLPWEELGLHAGFALVSLALAYALWMGPAQRFGELYAAAHRGSARAVVGCCGTTLVIGSLLGLLIAIGASTDEEEEEEPVRYVAFQTADAETAHYRFRYPVNLRERALGLIGGADAAYEAVRAALGAADGPPIVADLTETSGDHAGIASWQKIRVGLVGAADERRLLRVFHHETVHAFQFRESDRRMGDNAGATRFFAEGLAEYLAFELVPDPEERRRSRQAALAVWRRQRARFAELADDEAWSARRDTNAVYALGETWVAALVEVGGPEAPGRVLRAMARPDAPRGLAPLPFWQDTLQAAGYGLEQVDAAWRLLLERLAAEEAALLEALPALGGGVAEVEEDFVLLLATLDRPPLPGARYTLRVRAHAGARDTETFTFDGVQLTPEEVEFWVPRGFLEGRTFQYQFGQTLPGDAGGNWPYYEEWQTAPVPR